MIEKITRLPLRQVWKHEALDFTKWLEENIDVLNDVLGLSLENAESEQKAGSFSADIVAEENGRIAIIENQLERSDHDHLGKIITYLTMLDASIAIWIVSEPRPEHIQSISWLNESSSASFYLLKVEAIKIGESSPAPLLTLITGPSEGAIEAGKTKKELAERNIARQNYWRGLLEISKTRTKLHNNISPGIYNWIGSSAGLPNGLMLNYSLRKHDPQVELYIDLGKDFDEANLELFEKVYVHKDAVEKEFGGPVEWERLENKRACRIKKVIPVAGWMDEEKWTESQEAMVDAMIRLDRAIRPILKNI
jgi:dimeric dUTPase (all-alpha-NTP-PPase superfamily)